MSFWLAALCVYVLLALLSTIACMVAMVTSASVRKGWIGFSALLGFSWPAALLALIFGYGARAWRDRNE